MNLLLNLHSSPRKYGEDCAISGSINLLYQGAKFILLTVALQTIVYFIRKLSKYRYVHLENSQFQDAPAEQYGNQQLTKWIFLLEFLSITMLWVALLLISLSFPILASFEILEVGSARLLMIFCYTAGIGFQAYKLCQCKQQAFKRKKYQIYIVLQYLLFLLLAIFLTAFFQKACLCVYTYGYGFQYLSTMKFSTEMSRSLTINQPLCQDRDVCHVYATLSQQTHDEVIINVHTGLSISKVQVLFQDFFECQKFNFPSRIEERGQRHVFSCYVYGLSSATLYNFKIIGNGELLLRQAQYRTLPSTFDEQEVRVFIGGDFGYLKNGIDLVKTISQSDPDVILIGGDIAYDNGNLNCYYSYDLFLSLFEEEFDEMNRIVPFIFSIGNHDLGFNDYSHFNITVSEEEGPLYFTYFPQSVDRTSREIPEIFNRRTFNYHLIKSLIVFGLDTGYLYPHNGEQSEWMIDVLNKHKGIYTPIAHYHVPIFPSCYDLVLIWITIQKQNWIEIFDEYEFKAVFENHVHSFKRTFPLKAQQRNENGTIYFGDGSLGVDEEECEEEDQTFRNGSIFQGFFEEYRTENTCHYWLLQTQLNSLNLKAYDPTFKIVNGSEQKIDL